MEAKEEIITPDILGKTLEEAEKILKDTGLEMKINSESNDLDKSTNVVKKQIPQSGIKTYKGGFVYIDY